MTRKVVQIAVAQSATTESYSEALYALDSDGTIWEWRPAQSDMTSGWCALDNPWDDPPTKTKKKRAV